MPASEARERARTADQPDSTSETPSEQRSDRRPAEVPVLLFAASCSSATNIGAAVVRGAAGGREVTGEQRREATLLKIEQNRERVREFSSESERSGEAAGASQEKHAQDKTAAWGSWGRGIRHKPRPHTRRPDRRRKRAALVGLQTPGSRGRHPAVCRSGARANRMASPAGPRRCT